MIQPKILQNHLNFHAQILDFPKVTDYYFTWFDLQRKKYNMLFASHKHSFVLSCISVKHFMSNATPQNMFETLCITITSSISSLLLRKEASISRTNKKKFFLLLMKSGRLMHSTLKFLFLSKNSLWRTSWFFAQKLEFGRLKIRHKRNCE